MNIKKIIMHKNNRIRLVSVLTFEKRYIEKYPSDDTIFDRHKISIEFLLRNELECV